MIQNLTIPRLQALCRDVQGAFPKANVVIAGGAVRDLLNKRPIKDIDVFVYLDPVAALERTLEGELKPHYLADDEIAMAHYEGCEDLGKLFNCEPKMEGDPLDLFNTKGYSYGAFSLVDYSQSPYGHPIQLVFIDMDPVENIRHHFDLGHGPQRLVQRHDAGSLVAVVVGNEDFHGGSGL